MKSKKASSKFIRVKCNCGNEQNVFGCATSPVSCLVCGTGMTRTTGGHVVVLEDKAKVVRELE
ncbi:MAG: 30S ribosomal protein S27e [Candidatus Micrarchaeota archaeon]